MEVRSSTFKEGRELKKHADLTAEGENIEIADIGIVKKDGTGGWLPKAIQSPKKRGFAATARPNDAEDDAVGHV